MYSIKIKYLKNPLIYTIIYCINIKLIYALIKKLHGSNFWIGKWIFGSDQ